LLSIQWFLSENCTITTLQFFSIENRKNNLFQNMAREIHAENLAWCKFAGVELSEHTLLTAPLGFYSS
jgi:hypothetical protein